MLRTFDFDLKVVSKPFSKKLPPANFEFKWFEGSASLSQETVSTSSLKNCKQTENFFFPNAQNIRF